MKPFRIVIGYALLALALPVACFVALRRGRRRVAARRSLAILALRPVK